MTAIINDGRAHIAFEEEKVWPLLRGKLSSSGAENLGMQLLRAKDTAPTRPHPEVPPRPGILKATGPPPRPWTGCGTRSPDGVRPGRK